MSSLLEQFFERDRRVWDSCAETYEEQIVTGHPEVTAYEGFEEDLLDRMLLYLMREKEKNLCLFDIGCGSGRLHLRYGLRMTHERDLCEEEREKLSMSRILKAGGRFDGLFERQLQSVGGLDFAIGMLKIAERKLASHGLGSQIGSRLWLRQGSAFELDVMDSEPLPFAVTLCNSIGVMQGPEGAQELFKSMRRAIEASGGIAMISCYRRSAVPTFALGNYESTMKVCGQPRWLVPDTYAGDEYIQVPREYKRAHDPGNEIVVDVFDREGNLIKEGHLLKREHRAVREAIETGHITTHSDYESHWYGFDQFDRWIEQYWPKGRTYHIAGKDLDALRAEPVQLAILDTQGLLQGLVDRWVGSSA